MFPATEYPLIEGRAPGFSGACDSGLFQPVPTRDVDSATDCSELDPFFESTDYMGAFALGESAWTGGGSWFSTDLN